MNDGLLNGLVSTEFKKSRIDSSQTPEQALDRQTNVLNTYSRLLLGYD